MHFEKLIDTVVNLELSESKNQKLKKEYWIESAQQLETQGIEKEKVSEYLHKLIECKMNEKSDEPIKFESRYYYVIMSENGYTNPSFDRIRRAKAPKIISNKEYPEKDEYKILERIKQIAQNNITLSNRIIEKLTFDTDKILKNKKNISYDEQQELIKDAKSKIIERRKRFEQKFNESKITLKDITSTLKQQEQALHAFDDRVSVNTWNKIMITYLIDLGYDKLDIANALCITTKHIRANINTTEKRAFHKQLIQDTVKQCPNCKVELMDYIEQKINSYKAQ